MYIIKRNNKRFNNKMFATYELARSYVRKWLRARALEVFAYGNAAIGNHAFSIKLQAA